MKRSLWFVFLLALLLVPLCAANGEAADASALSDGADIRIMSYNILHPDWSHVPIQGRDALVADILLCYRPDVAAIQEAGAKCHKTLKALLVDNGYYAPACRQSNADVKLFNAVIGCDVQNASDHIPIYTDLALK